LKRFNFDHCPACGALVSVKPLNIGAQKGRFIMAQFYAEIQGNRGMASRMGTKTSGMWAHIRGWNVGVKVECYHDDNGKDVIYVSATNGSNDPGSKPLAILRENDFECVLK